MAGSLLMSCYNVSDLIRIHIERIIDIEHGTSGIPENGIYALLDKTFGDYICALH